MHQKTDWKLCLLWSRCQIHLVDLNVLSSCSSRSGQKSATSAAVKMGFDVGSTAPYAHIMIMKIFWLQCFISSNRLRKTNDCILRKVCVLGLPPPPPFANRLLSYLDLQEGKACEEWSTRAKGSAGPCDDQDPRKCQSNIWNTSIGLGFGWSESSQNKRPFLYLKGRCLHTNAQNKQLLHLLLRTLTFSSENPAFRNYLEHHFSTSSTRTPQLFGSLLATNKPDTTSWGLVYLHLSKKSFSGA